MRDKAKAIAKLAPLLLEGLVWLVKWAWKKYQSRKIEKEVENGERVAERTEDQGNEEKEKRGDGKGKKGKA